MTSMIKSAYVGIATISLGVGIIGVVIPLLPTTPFLLLSAALYIKGSERHYNRFINIPWVGNAIRDYHDGKGVSLKVKTIAILFLWGSISASLYMMNLNSFLNIALLLIAVVVSIHLLLLKTNKNISKNS